jgi:hypothetical protein
MVFRQSPWLCEIKNKGGALNAPPHSCHCHYLISIPAQQPSVEIAQHIVLRPGLGYTEKVIHKLIKLCTVYEVV